jgi:hypothetical protein
VVRCRTGVIHRAALVFSLRNILRVIRLNKCKVEMSNNPSNTNL